MTLRGQVVHTDVAPDMQNRPCMDDREIRELVRVAKRIEEHYGCSQDIEWAIDKGIPFPENVFIVQSHPETVWSHRKKEPIISKKGGYELLMKKTLTSTRAKL